ncbi:MAG: NPCBM/NEW2 domain-containing protein [Planctomycetota bacterium]
MRTRGAVDRVAGELEQFRRGFALARERNRRLTWLREGVLAACLAGATEPEAQDGLRVVVDFQRLLLSGRLVGAGGRDLALECRLGGRVALHADRILRISVRGGDFVHLSDLPEKSLRETPFVEGGVAWGLRRDRGFEGGRVTVGGRYFPKALAVHSRTELEFAVPEGMRYLDVWYGIDDAVAGRSVKGAVAFSVRVGDRELAPAVTRRAGEAPGHFERLDLGGATSVVLRADFADRQHFNGWAIWGDPMFIRGE